MRITLEPIGAVYPSAYNPRQADERRLRLVELSLRRLGFLLPIYAGPDGEIVSGHQRHLIAERMGVPLVPVVRLKHEDILDRKAINIAFNRATNDLRQTDSSASITEQLDSAHVERLAELVPEKQIGSEAFYPCVHRLAERSPRELAEQNTGRWIPYAAGMAKKLRNAGVPPMPVILRRSGVVVNGIGRLEDALGRIAPSIECVELDDAEADLAEGLLNWLSMDFSIERRYADFLRHNSFRRQRGIRSRLGTGYIIGMQGGRLNSLETFDIADPDSARAWIVHYGANVLDFGAGHGTEAELLRAAGVRVTTFEPYRIDTRDEIDEEGSIRGVEAFLEQVEASDDFDTVFVNSVLNSVPFREDREHVVAIVASLCGPHTRVEATSQSVRASSWRTAQGVEANDATHRGSTNFRLDYEPGVQLDGLTTKPKVQKFHTDAEWAALWGLVFREVEGKPAGRVVYARCARPRRAEILARLPAAIAFEFDLPYPSTRRMGLADRAARAFARRLMIDEEKLCADVAAHAAERLIG